MTMGELLRSEAQSSSSLGTTIKTIIDQGNIVPGSLAIQILRKELERVIPQGLEGVLLDGFPRNLEQMEEYEKYIGQFDHALYFDVKSEVLVWQGENMALFDSNSAVEALELILRIMILT
mmetsp:Transcript_28279/g.111015  ORF Transcript_28279/g.111015 Transcript_28279/m.111015 type:complete len:120 (-) Transcript_28279:772-1131(-)